MCTVALQKSLEVTGLAHGEEECTPLLTLDHKDSELLLCWGGFVTGLSSSNSSAGPHNHLAVDNTAKRQSDLCLPGLAEERWWRGGHSEGLSKLRVTSRRTDPIWDQLMGEGDRREEPPQGLHPLLRRYF